MSIRFLKVKIKSLSAEARIIRLEEGRSRGELRFLLRQHRRREVRSESRASLIAYGYLRGRSYTCVEPGAKGRPDWSAVQRMVKKYGAPEALEKLKAWREIKTE
jgi:hypothetical protein